jgi:DNA-binding beta-propeller fold protein YncE
MRNTVTVLFAVCILWMVLPACAGRLVDPGGGVLGLAADPTRPVFYASLDTSEVVTIDASGSITARVGVPETPGALAVDPDGSRLYVALAVSHDIGVVELGGGGFSGTIELSAEDRGPSDLVPGKPGRLYAVCNDGLSIIDTVNGRELYFGDLFFSGTFYNSQLAVSTDRNTLYSLTESNTAIVTIFDVSGDLPVFLGQGETLGSWGRDIAVSPSCSKVYVATSEYYLEALCTVPLLYHETNVVTGDSLGSIAPSADGTRVYAGSRNGRYLYAADTSDVLPWAKVPTQGELADHGLVLSSDDATLAASIIDKGIELFTVKEFGARYGGVKFRPLDEITGDPVIANVLGGPGSATFWYVDVENGVMGFAPIGPGDCSFEVRSPGYETVSFTAPITAGHWTDLGNAVMKRSGGRLGPQSLVAGPPVRAGSTVDIEIHGIGFSSEPGLTVTSNSGLFVINSYAFRNWSTVDVNVTVDPSMPEGRMGSWSIRVSNADGQSESTHIAVVKMNPSPFPPLQPPNPIPMLYAVKSLAGDVELLWRDSDIGVCGDAASGYAVFRSVTRPDGGFEETVAIEDPPFILHEVTDAGAIDSGPTLQYYRISASNSVGDSGDRPPM